MGLLEIYTHQKNRVFDEFLLRVRSRFNGTRMIARNDGVKAILRGYREGFSLQLSPDMDLGARDSIFVPFFGVPAATVTALSRMSRLTGAPIVPAVIRQLDGSAGYVHRGPRARDARAVPVAAQALQDPPRRRAARLSVEDPA